MLNLQARAQQYEEAWERSIEKVQQIGGTCVEVDYAPFQEAGGIGINGLGAWASTGENEQRTVHLKNTHTILKRKMI